MRCTNGGPGGRARALPRGLGDPLGGPDRFWSMPPISGSAPARNRMFNIFLNLPRQGKSRSWATAQNSTILHQPNFSGAGTQVVSGVPERWLGPDGGPAVPFRPPPGVC